MARSTERVFGAKAPAPVKIAAVPAGDGVSKGKQACTKCNRKAATHWSTAGTKAMGEPVAYCRSCLTAYLDNVAKKVKHRPTHQEMEAEIAPMREELEQCKMLMMNLGDS